MTITPRPILISGAGWGAGASCAEQLSEAGARIFLIDRDSNRCEAIAERTGGHQVIGDVTDYAVVERAVSAATLIGGGLSAYIHAIPMLEGTSIDATRGPELGAAFATNVASLITFGSAVLRSMELVGEGILIRIDWVPEEIPCSLQILRAAQEAAWKELASSAAEYGIRAETLTVLGDRDPDAIGLEVTEMIRLAFTKIEQEQSI